MAVKRRDTEPAASDAEDLLDRHVKRNRDMYESGVLRPAVHHQLVERSAEFAGQAGVRISDLTVPLSDVCTTDVEQEFVRRFRKLSRDTMGLIYVGDYRPPVMRRMCVMAATFVRNFIDARVRMAEDIVTNQISDDPFDYGAVLLVPDFAPGGVKLSDMRRRALTTVLVARSNVGLRSVLWAESHDDVAAYGPAVEAMVADGMFEVRR